MGLLEGILALVLPPSGRRSVSVPGMGPVAATVQAHVQGNKLTQPDDRLLFRVRPNPASPTRLGDYEVNRLGYRGRDVDLSRVTPEDAVVAIYGDSCAFGWDNPEWRRSWAGQLELQLAAAGRPTLVLNFGQPGFSSTQTRALLEDTFGWTRADHVVFYLGWNDVWATPMLTDREMMRARAGLEGVKRILRRTHLFQGLEDLLSLASPVREDWPWGRVRVPTAEAVENFQAMVERVTEEGARAWILLPPSVPPPRGRPFSGNPSPGLQALPDLAPYNCAVLRALTGRARFPSLRSLRGDPSQFHGDGYHPNQEGSVAIARELTAFLLDQGGTEEADEALLGCLPP